MYNNTSSGGDIIDVTVIFPICVVVAMFICFLTRWMCISGDIDGRLDSLPKYEDIEARYPDCPECIRETESIRDTECRQETETTPPKYEEVV